MKQIQMNYLSDFFFFLIRPRFFILGQVDNTGIYKSITYFPSVRI